MDYLDAYYQSYDEDSRLLSRCGQVEYITTMKYIHTYLNQCAERRVLEVGAGTGRYSLALAKEGCDVTAVELVEHNLAVLRAKLDGTEALRAVQGNALDLSCLEGDAFDMTLLLGPMYHLYDWADKVKALSEAVRVTKPGGYILVAYCLNEATILQYVFWQNQLRQVLERHMLTPDWHCISEPWEVFELIRTEEIAALDATVPVERLKLVATDGAAHYQRKLIDAMDEAAFEKWIEYHLITCERQDLIGASNHALDILQKRIVM